MVFSPDHDIEPIPDAGIPLGETAEMLRDTVRSFASDNIAPLAAEIDAEGRVPASSRRSMG